MARQQVILAVDRNRRNLQLLAYFLEKEGFQTIGANSLEEFDEKLVSEAIDIALVDVSGFDNNIWQRCEQLRDRQINFVTLSPTQSAALQKESLKHGAEEMLVKPLVVQELVNIISNMLEK